MQEYKRVIRAQKHHLSDAACEEIKSQFSVDDERGVLSTFNAFWFQFQAHQTNDSVEINGKRFNRYNGLDDGEGVYPARRDSPLLSRAGYFITSEYGLPALHDTMPPIELTVDAHRGNENRVLKAMHLMAIRIHNRRMDEHGNYDLAKAETISTLNRVTLNEAMTLTGIESEPAFFDINIKDLHLSMEWNFAIGRWAHAQMPDTVNGDPVFQKGPSIGIDLLSLQTKEKARILNLGVSTAMTQMDHLKDPKNILDRTFGQHNNLRLPCYQDAANQMRIKTPVEIEGCPLFPGVLIECKDGQLGPVGRRLIADGIAGSLAYGMPGNGLWHDRWTGAPTRTLDIIEYSLGG